MILYRLLRWISGLAIHWFYREIQITNRQAIPEDGPLFIAVNHQNALVDSLITGWVVRRNVTMTAKATLMDNPVIALLFRVLGVVPLKRTSDETGRRKSAGTHRARNNDAFSEILDVLEANGAVLIFPEGKSHNESGLEPLKTGLARLALKAREDRRIHGLKILPVGLVFEDKATPGSTVAVHIGEVIDVDSWPDSDPSTLTTEISRRLKSVLEVRAIPDPDYSSGIASVRPLSPLERVGAGWGRLTHELPIRFARRLALRNATDSDQPAMRTIVLGTGLVLLTYGASFAVIEALIHSVWIALIFVLSLGVGAYYAAFESHRRPE